MITAISSLHSNKVSFGANPSKIAKKTANRVLSQGDIADSFQKIVTPKGLATKSNKSSTMPVRFDGEGEHKTFIDDTTEMCWSDNPTGQAIWGTFAVLGSTVSSI